MSEFKRLTDELSVAAQLRPEDMAAAKAAGFRSILNNRPDSESADQPASDEMAAQAAALGLHYHHQPVISGQITDANIEEFAKLYAAAEKPVLAFCRTGTRCTFLWALSQAPAQPLDALASQAAQAGYDLSGLMPRLQQRREG